MSPSNLRTTVLALLDRLTPRQVFVIIVAVFTLGLLLYSQTMGFVWDEGFHLLAAQLILKGKTPYIDFCFPQTPLNAYWNAAWLYLSDQDWRITHVTASFEVAGSIFLMGNWILRSFPVPRWRFPCALATAFLMACNTVVVQFGTIAQAYGAGMLLSAAAFRSTLAAARNESARVAFSAGLFASAAAGCTLLTAPVVPVLLVWLWIYSQANGRLKSALAFLIGCLPPFLPVLLLYFKGPAQTLFNVVSYQALFRRVNWKGASTHDIDVFSAWLQSTPALLLLFLGVAGFFYLRKASWDERIKAEFRLAAYLGVALILYIATAHPTFQRYMIVAVPFCAVVSAVGLYDLGTRLTESGNPVKALLILCCLMSLSIAKDLFDDREAIRWDSYERIAHKIREVTPPNAALYADEQVYFLLQRKPPFAMEFSYSHKLQLPKDQEKLYHIISEAELTEQVKGGKYATVENCKEDRIEELKLSDLFTNESDVGDCEIHWGFKGAAAAKK